MKNFDQIFENFTIFLVFKYFAKFKRFCTIFLEDLPTYYQMWRIFNKFFCTVNNFDFCKNFATSFENSSNIIKFNFLEHWKKFLKTRNILSNFENFLNYLNFVKFKEFTFFKKFDDFAIKIWQNIFNFFKHMKNVSKIKAFFHFFFKNLRIFQIFSKSFKNVVKIWRFLPFFF